MNQQLKCEILRLLEEVETEQSGNKSNEFKKGKFMVMLMREGIYISILLGSRVVEDIVNIDTEEKIRIISGRIKRTSEGYKVKMETKQIIKGDILIAQEYTKSGYVKERRILMNSEFGCRVRAMIEAQKQYVEDPHKHNEKALKEDKEKYEERIKKLVYDKK